ncbi:MAG: single-stranded-DNA-specific exonuclease RecJ [Treponema sp.]|jgi:single-stranded-DNA-specific exonuclease|nr:single-stranded-DNA-specific exonuclease RecJ [Treponema sp.]
MNWEKKDIPQELVKEVTAKYGCDLLTSSILVRRGITSGEDIRYFLEDDPRHLHNPFEFPGMEDAVDRILAAKEEGEKVLVFGDRDVDGITGTTLVTNYLTSLGIDVTWRIPAGDEPYGLSLNAVEEFAAAFGTLIITVDCGISCFNEIKRANELSVDVIVTDHHNPPEALPEAFCIINPKLADTTYPFRDLAGCGVACKLVSALRFAAKSDLYGQPVCLLNTRPLNDAWIIEVAKLRNLAITGRLTETVVPGMVNISDTRLPAFLQGQQILVWDAPLQKRTLTKLFGGGVEVGMLDIAGEIGKIIPQTAGQSLLRIKELSRIARYAGSDLTELDVFINLFGSFAQKRESLFTAEHKEDLQLAALGTIADLMPLEDENRIIVRCGLESLCAKPRHGLSDLLFKLGLAGRHFETRDISWQLCPTINAAGRMGNPQKAVELLLEKDGAKRDTLAEEIIGMNKARKALEEEVWAVAEPMAQKNISLYGEKLAFAYGSEMNRGVTGLIAQRLARHFKLPALVVSFGEKTVTGSLRTAKDPRSARGYDVRSLIQQCEDLLIDWGGHNFAAGFSMDKTNWEPFTERIKTASYAIELESDDGEETVTVDAELPHSFMTADIFKVVDRFEPYGEGNEPLTFLAKKIKIQDISLMGPNKEHVKLTLDFGKYKWAAVYWRAAERVVNREFAQNDTVDMVFTLARNWFKGIETPQILVTDLIKSSEGN